MVATARFLPVKIITDREKIRAFAKWTSPLIRFVDPIIGEKVLPLSQDASTACDRHHRSLLKGGGMNAAATCDVGCTCVNATTTAAFVMSRACLSANRPLSEHIRSQT